MPLYEGAADAILRQLQALDSGRRVSLIAIGSFTRDQHEAILAFRRGRGLGGGESPEIVYLGRHHHRSRSAQGYAVEDLVRQIASALAADSIVRLHARMTGLQSRCARDDVGSSRVDLQACKLEYSIVSPK